MPADRIPDLRRGLRRSAVDPFETFEALNEVTWALGRLPDRTYIHRAFTLDLRASQDYGQPARFVVKVFDEVPSVSTFDAASPDPEWTEYVVMTTPGGRKQIKLQVAREAGLVREIQIQRVPTTPGATKLETLLTLDREGSARLIDLIRALQYIPVDGTEATVRIDDQTVRDIFANPDALQRMYGSSPTEFRRMISEDPSANDLVAIAHRREVIAEFRRLLIDAEFFEQRRVAAGGSREKVWQRLFEDEPWILGVGLSGQLLTSWDERRLEQVVAGFSIGGPGKRADAVLRTAGRIKSLVFAEIKHHQTDLLGSDEYRTGCWPASPDVVGGVTQVQQTLHLASRQLGDRLIGRDDTGANTDDVTYLLRPRSFLIVGHLSQLMGQQGLHEAKHQSFELYRRNLYEPEIVTFDEVLARAEWTVALAEDQQS